MRREAKDALSAWTNLRLCGFGEQDCAGISPFFDLVADFGEHWTAACATRGLLDFTDLLRVSLALLRPGTCPTARAALGQQFTHFFVDELQDTSRVQADLLLELCAASLEARTASSRSSSSSSSSAGGAGGAPALTVVGDPRQSIYGFAGAQPAVFARIAAQWPTARHRQLSRNYRSSANIVLVLAPRLSPAAPWRPRARR